MKNEEQIARTNISISREEFLDNVLYASDNNELNITGLSKLLSDYEKLVQMAVESNLQMNFTNLNDTELESFPVQSEKWTLMQAIFFGATICTTIGLLAGSEFIKF